MASDNQTTESDVMTDTLVSFDVEQLSHLGHDDSSSSSPSPSPSPSPPQTEGEATDVDDTDANKGLSNQSDETHVPLPLVGARRIQKDQGVCDGRKSRRWKGSVYISIVVVTTTLSFLFLFYSEATAITREDPTIRSRTTASSSTTLTHVGQVPHRTRPHLSPTQSHNSRNSPAHETAVNTTAANTVIQEGRIVGGTPTVRNQYPFVVSLLDRTKTEICGGSLITPTIVLTAAHCVRNIKYADLNKYSTSDQEDVVRRYSFKRITSHPSFNEDNLNFDFALVQLDTSLSPSSSDYKANAESVIPLNLNPAYPRIGEEVTVLGWGRTSQNGDPSAFLRRANVNYISNGNCAEKYDGALISNVMLCASYPNRDACQGDSGGPLVYAKREERDAGNSVEGEVGRMVLRLVGVVSWGWGCADERHPGVYARVSGVSDWIHREVCRWTPEACVNGVIRDFTEDYSEDSVGSDLDYQLPSP